MKKRSGEYWKDRFLNIEKASNAYGVEAFRQIEPAFDEAQRAIQREIERWYSRYAKNNQISITEARKALTTKELKELRWDVNEYIKRGRENAFNGQWVKELENASARVHISRLEALKIRTQQAAEVAFGNELDVIDDMARKVYTEDYYRSIYEMQKGFNIGWDIGTIDQKKLDKLIVKPWTADNKTFADRIWQTKTQMVSELHQQLTRTCVLGKSPDKAIEALTKYVDKDIKNKKYVAGRLVMTEQAYFHSVAQRDAFNDLDVEEFEIVATLDSHTSPVCQEMDGKHMPMSQYEPGVTAPPFHVFCRSVTVPYFEDNFGGERAARDADGNTYYVPDSMTYNDWKKSMVGKDADKMSSSNSSIDLRFAKPIHHSAEELKELEMYANERGFKVYNINDFDGDSDVLKEEIDVLNGMKTEYKYNERLTISFGDFEPRDLARTKPNSKTIEFNRCALRDRNLTNAFLNADDQLSSTDIKGIAAHEMGHKLYEKYGNKGLDISKEVYYNIYGDLPSNQTIIKFLFESVSQYSIDMDAKYDFKPFKAKHMKEIIPEMFGKHLTNPDEFTAEFIKLLKGAWNL